MIPVALVLGVVGLWWFTRRKVLFRLAIRDGVVTVVSGRIGPRLLTDFREVVGRSRVTRASVVAYADDHGTSLVTKGDLDEGTAQRLRNVFRLYPVALLRSAPAVRPTWSKLAAASWFGWMIERVVGSVGGDDA